MLFGLLDVLLTLDSSVVGYIYLISPVKSCNVITYFDMMIQTLVVNYRGFSYREDLREKLIKVEENHSQLK